MEKLTQHLNVEIDLLGFYHEFKLNKYLFSYR